MSSIQLTPIEERSPGIGEITPLLLPEPETLYLRRANRLRHLAVGHAMADYLAFIAGLVEAQQHVLTTSPLSPALSASLIERISQQPTPLADSALLSEPYWHELLRQLTDQLYPTASALIRNTLDMLRDQDARQLETLAHSLISGQYRPNGSGQAVFVWAALSLFFTQLAAKLPLEGKAHLGERRQHCPLCGGIPVASSIMSGSKAGLRYLQCSLCSSHWHMVRVKCSNCEETGKIDYWSLEELNKAIKAESCGDCGSYLKILYPEHDHEAELLADDLATLALDAEMEREGFARSGLNPFLLPG